MPTISVEEYRARVGSEIGVSDWVAVTQQRIDIFAEATGDHQFIHVDPARAAQTPFGGTIAHGFLTLSLMPLLIENAGIPEIAGVTMRVNYGGNTLRFLAPVRAGKRIRGRFTLLELDEKRPGQWQQTMASTIEIEGEDKPALVAEWISQFFI